MPGLARTNAAQFFISYAREDKTFAVHLRSRLAARGRLAWLDLKNIGALAPWRTEIATAIDAADVFVFLISPQAVTSSACRDELRLAVDAKKRLAPLVLRDTADHLVPAALRTPNWLFVRKRENLENLVDRLVRAADRDPDWIRDHSRLLTRARGWLQHERDPSRLLIGQELQDALRWLAESSRRGDREVSRLQAEYIDASRQADAAASARQRELYLKALARQLAAQSELNRGSADHPVETPALLAIESLSRRPTVEGDRAFRRSLALISRPPLNRIVHAKNETASMTADGSAVAIARPRTLRLVDIGSGLERWRLRLGFTVDRVEFGAGDQVVIVLSEKGRVQVIRRDDAAVLGGCRFDASPCSVAVDPEARFVAVATTKPGATPSIGVWLLGQDAPVLTVPLDAPASALAIFDGVLATVVSAPSPMGHSRVLAWDIAAGGEPRELWKVYGKVSSSAMAANGEWVALTAFAFGAGLSTDVSVGALSGRVADPHAFETMRRLVHDEPVDRIERDAEGRLVTWTRQGSVIHVWDPGAGTLVGRFRVKDSAYRAALAADGQSLVVAHADRRSLRAPGRISLVASDGTTLFSTEPESMVDSLTCDVEGRVTASTSKHVTRWDTDTSSAVRQFAAAQFTSMAFSGNSTHVLVKAPKSGSLVVPVDRAAPIVHLKQPGSIWSASFAGDDATRVVTVGNPSVGTQSSGDPHVRLWDVDGAKILALRRRHFASPIAVSPDGKLAALIAVDGSVHVRQVADGRVRCTLRPGEAVRELLFDVHGQHLAVTTKDRAHVWRLTDRVQIGSLRVGERQDLQAFDGARNLALMRDSRSTDPSGALVKVSDGRTIVDDLVRPTVDFSRRRVASIAEDRWVDVHEVKRRGAGRLLMRVFHQYVNGAELAPDGLHVASSGADGSVRVWQLVDGAELARLDHPDRVLGVQFSPDARFIATVCSDDILRLWTWRAEDLIAEGRRRIARRLSGDELDTFLPDPETRQT